MTASTDGDADCAARVELIAVPGVPVVEPGDDLAAVIAAAAAAVDLTLRAGDVVVVPSKVVARAEGRFVDLATVDPGPRAAELAALTGKDPRLVELVLRESTAVSRAGRGALIVQHRLGFVTADAGIDQSNAAPPAAVAARGVGPWALLLPADPDASAARLRAGLEAAAGVAPAIVISDSFGRPFRVGTVGCAVGVAGLPPLRDHRGRSDLFGRPLERTVTALADQLAAAADLVAGQAGEGRAAVVVRGVRIHEGVEAGAAALYRQPAEDLYL
ncbi:MAG: coenzyme F420-0:L-glutamate ligase [Kofleriaceae bacterium]|nr:coenzyme F420-0:L-glutamate ligase [Kofleriaceae bacterium]MCB9573829.1 coenzyme F420-0:L-glutamate ligase [Kofleriaceae bacterium]